MIVKLKTLEKLIEEFGFKESFKGLEDPSKKWFITNVERRMLGTKIEVEELKIEKIKNLEVIPYPYTHYSKGDNIINLYWHELWFEPEEFIDEREFRI